MEGHHDWVGAGHFAWRQDDLYQAHHICLLSVESADETTAYLCGRLFLFLEAPILAVHSRQIFEQLLLGSLADQYWPWPLDRLQLRLILVVAYLHFWIVYRSCLATLPYPLMIYRDGYAYHGCRADLDPLQYHDVWIRGGLDRYHVQSVDSHLVREIQALDGRNW
jgi:hypothetical protein